MTTEEKLIENKRGLLKPAAYLKNVSEAYRWSLGPAFLLSTDH